MILYRSSLSNYYHLVLVVGGWLLYKSENFQNMGEFYRSATIENNMIRKHVQSRDFFVSKWIYSRRLDPKARARTENTETVVTGIYY
jgi:hypothetical protein